MSDYMVTPHREPGALVGDMLIKGAQQVSEAGGRCRGAVLGADLKAAVLSSEEQMRSYMEFCRIYCLGWRNYREEMAYGLNAHLSRPMDRARYNAWYRSSLKTSRKAYKRRKRIARAAARKAINDE